MLTVRARLAAVYDAVAESQAAHDEWHEVPAEPYSEV